MPIEKPKKPTELIPRAFGGIKNNFSDDLQSTGFEPNIPQTYNGDNLNYHLDATGKELDYVEKVVDFINQAPVNHIPFVNENNQLDYVDASSLGSGSFDMFDTKISDHILEGKEAKGWALQGTYVTKESYPNFYQRCLEEYRNSSEAIIGVEPWIQPIATANTTAIYGGDMIVSASSEYSGEGAWKAFDGNNTSTHFAFNAKNSGWWQIKFPYKLLIKGLTYYSRANASIYPVETATFYTSSDMTQQIGDTFSAPTTDYTAFEVQNIPQDGIVTDTIYLTMNGSGSTCGMGELVINAQKLINENCYSIYKNNNGHKFYPIEQKSIFDAIYNQYGIADFYGIDEENERIFLPRDLARINKGIVQTFLAPDYTKATTLKSGSVAPENGWIVTTLVCNSGYPSVSINGVKVGYCGPSANTEAPFGAYTVKKGDVITGSTVTFFPVGNNEKMETSDTYYLYYCVGNTEVTQAITNVTEVTTSENDTIPLFAGMYLDFKPNNVSWLKAGEQQNGGSIYKTCYDQLVEIVNGVNNFDLKVINVADKLVDVDYSEYWILDQDNLTFRTPIRTSERVLIESKIATDDDPTWYNLYSDGWLEQGGKITAGNNGKTFVMFIRPYIDTNITMSVMQTGGASNSIGRFAFWNSTENITQTGVYADVGNATLPATWRACGYAEVPISNNLYFKVANAVQNLELLDAGRVMEEAVLRSSLVEAQVVVETYKNGDSWYRVYSDGWCEQGGTGTNNASAVGTITTTLLKTYVDNTYTILLTRAISSTQSLNVVYKSNNSFHAQSSNTPVGLYYWQTSGYIK